MLYFILSCSDREPLNPLDPNNPFTAGKPTGLRLLPIQSTVKIIWNPIDVNDLTFYAVYKGVSGSEMFKRWEVSPDSTFILDTNVSFFDFHFAQDSVKPAEMWKRKQQHGMFQL